MSTRWTIHYNTPRKNTFRVYAHDATSLRDAIRGTTPTPGMRVQLDMTTRTFLVYLHGEVIGRGKVTPGHA